MGCLGVGCVLPTAAIYLLPLLGWFLWLVIPLAFVAALLGLVLSIAGFVKARRYRAPVAWPVAAMVPSAIVVVLVGAFVVTKTLGT